MTTHPAFLLKLSDGSIPAVYNTVAGLRTTALTITGEAVEVPPKDGWRELLSGAGTRSVSIDATGIFLGNAAETEVRALALAGMLEDCQLSFEDGTRLQGRFLIQRLNYLGGLNGERNYSMHLESAGEVVTP